jgi:hypothetical protein
MRKKNLIILLISLSFLSSCLEVKKKKEIIKNDDSIKDEQKRFMLS